MTLHSVFSAVAASGFLLVLAFAVVKLTGIIRRIRMLKAASPIGGGIGSASPMRFNIAVVSINEHKEVFEDLVCALQAAIVDLGIDCTRTDNVFVDDAINIVIGAVMFVSEQVAAQLAGKPYVLYQMEQLAAGRWDLGEFPAYLDVMRNARCVWDYSLSNVERLRQLGLPDAIPVPAGYHAVLETLPPVRPQDIDVLFYGSLSARRKHIIEMLRASGVTVEVLFGVYGEARNAMIARAKIVLNVHAAEIDTLEEIRLSYLLSNHCFVISERSDRNPYGDGVVFRPYEQLADTCVAFLNAGEQARKEIAECGYRAIRNMDYGAIVRAALQRVQPI